MCSALLTLAIVSACQISAFKNTESYIGEIARIFKFSAKQYGLDQVIESVCPSAHAKKLKDTCKTRWIQHIDSYTIFLELLPAVHTTLQAMVSPANYQEFGTEWNWDGETDESYKIWTLTNLDLSYKNVHCMNCMRITYGANPVSYNGGNEW